MPSCPKCSKEISYILAQTDATQEITVDTTEPSWDIDHEWITYACPECGEEITDSFDEAVKLMGGTQ